MKLTKIPSVLFLLSVLGGCSAIPGAGPFDDTIKGDAEVSIKVKENTLNEYHDMRYALVDVTLPLTMYLSQENDAAQVYDWPDFAPLQGVRINIGDQLQVTIFEAMAGGLFIPEQAGIRPGNFINLPTQTVDGSGTITIPYAGQIQAAGRLPSELEADIVERLKQRAIDPQAVVGFAARGGSEISVLGQVNRAQRYSLNFNGERILDAIARAGGPVGLGHDMQVTLQRKGTEKTIPFDVLLQKPDANIYLEPDDTVYVFQQPKSYMVFGAAEVNGRHTFPRRELQLSEALADARGLRSNQADAEEVYIFRQEPKDRLSNLVDTDDAEKWAGIGENVPTIYRVNLREAGGFLLAQQFEVRDGDVVYIADAPTVDLLKFLALLSPGASTAVNTRNVTN